MSTLSRDGYDETTTSVPEYVLIGTNFHNSEERNYSQRFTISDNLRDFPENATLGFRNNFWRVFSAITEFERNDFEFEWLGRPWTFVSFWLADSSNVDFASYLDDPKNVFLIFVLRPRYTDQHIPIRRLIFGRKSNEQQAIAELIDCFQSQGYYGFLRLLRHNREFNALFTWTTPTAPASMATAIAFFSFYSFCLLMSWKIAREQTHINIAVENNDLQAQLKTVLRIRSQIINVERYFLTQNISNDRSTNLIARDIRDRFGLEDKFNRFLPLNESIERHLQTAIQMRADLKSTILNFIAFFAVIIGLPLSLMSMLLTLNLTSPIIKDGRAILIHKDSILFILTASASALAMIGMLALATFYIIKRFR